MPVPVKAGTGMTIFLIVYQANNPYIVVPEAFWLSGILLHSEIICWF